MKYISSCAARTVFKVPVREQKKYRTQWLIIRNRPDFLLTWLKLGPTPSPSLRKLSRTTSLAGRRSLETTVLWRQPWIIFQVWNSSLGCMVCITSTFQLAIHVCIREKNLYCNFCSIIMIIIGIVNQYNLNCIPESHSSFTLDGTITPKQASDDRV